MGRGDLAEPPPGIAAHEELEFEIHIGDLHHLNTPLTLFSPAQSNWSGENRAKFGPITQSHNLMTGLTGQRGAGDTDSLEWTDGRLTGVAQRVAKKYAALAVASSDDCPGTDLAPVVAAPVTTAEPSPAPDTQPTIDAPAPASGSRGLWVFAGGTPAPQWVEFSCGAGTPLGHEQVSLCPGFSDGIARGRWTP